MKWKVIVFNVTSSGTDLTPFVVLFWVCEVYQLWPNIFHVKRQNKFDKTSTFSQQPSPFDILPSHVCGIRKPFISDNGRII